MKWIKKKLTNWLLSDGIDSNRVKDPKSPDSAPVLNFRIYNAVNGQILEFHRWDEKSDRSYNSIYIVEKDQDIAKYVSKCLSMELLK